MKRILSLILMSIMLAGCTGGVKNSDKPRIYTSFYSVYSLTKTVAGDKADIINLMPQGMEPHDFEPTAADIMKLSKSDMLIYNGSGIDDWAADIEKTLDEPIKVTRLYPAPDRDDPHTWLSFENVYNELDTICEALCEIDAANAELYKENKDDYEKKLKELQAQFENAGFGGKKMFVTHGAYGHLCRELGMEQVALEGIWDLSDPSPAKMAQVIADIKESGAKCIFYDPYEGDDTALAAADEAGIEAIPLSAFETDDKNRDYYTVMSENLEQMKKGLK